MSKAKKTQARQGDAVEISEDVLDQAAGGFSWGATQQLAADQQRTVEDVPTESLSLNFTKIEYRK